MYDTGKGVAVDHRRAFELYDRAAGRGSAQGMYNKGCAYRDGEGVEVSLSSAFYWFRVAASRGHRGGQYNTGCMLANGDGAPRNLVDARSYFEKAAAQGHTDARTAIPYVDRDIQKTLDRLNATMEAEGEGPERAEHERQRQELAAALVRAVPPPVATSGSPPLGRSGNNLSADAERPMQT